MNAVIFSGQGAQKVGMGKALAEVSEGAREIFRIADEYTEGLVSRLCFEGPQSDLDLTINTQPCVFTVEVAYLEALRERGIEADVTAGFSLGEYGALVCSKVLSFEDALKMVVKRGQLMNTAAQKQEGSMAAIIGINNEEIYSMCKAASGYVEPVNYNCPGQTVVAGDKNAIYYLVQKLRSLNKGKIIPLAVSGAFHSKHMSSAAQEYESYINSIEFMDPVIPFVSNVTGDFVKSGAELKSLAVRQIKSPVLWEKSMRTMISAGVNRFIEAGPGRALTGFTRKINNEVEAVLADSLI